jgi:hypothetical protein
MSAAHHVTAEAQSMAFATSGKTRVRPDLGPASHVGRGRYTVQKPPARRTPAAARINPLYGFRFAAQTTPLAPSTATSIGARTGLTQHESATTVTAAAANPVAAAPIVPASRAGDASDLLTRSLMV